MNREKVSIVMMAYNQAKFIAQAVESVIAQKHIYDWELLISDDHSTDNTHEIVKIYLNLFPENIFYFKNDTNIGLHKNYESIIKKSSGEYIALLEADDYWLDPLKLSLQLELLIKDPTINWCFTNGIMVDSEGVLLKKIDFDFPAIFESSKFTTNFFNPLNNTVVFRKSSEPRAYPDFFYGIAQWDTVLHYLRSVEGNIGFIAINGLAWRRHEGATSFTANYNGQKRYLDWILMNESLKMFYPKKFSKYFDRKYVSYEALAILSFKSKKYTSCTYYFFKMIFNKTIRPLKEYKDFFWKLLH